MPEGARYGKGTVAAPESNEGLATTKQTKHREAGVVT